MKSKLEEDRQALLSAYTPLNKKEHSSNVEHPK
jgi:hypothetical protein